MELQELLEYCLQHFKSLDESNATIHTASVRYSPITFRLAEALRDITISYSDNVDVVLDHLGVYEEDTGRK